MSRRHKIQKHGMRVASVVKKVAPWFVFVSQATSKDMGAITSQPTAFGQLKTIANVLTGRMTGFNLFKGGTPQFAVTRNWSAMANNYSFGSLALIGYGLIARKSKALPMGSYALSLGKRILPAALLGGVIDAPDASVPQQQYSAPYGYSTSSLGVNPFSVPTGNIPVYNTGGN